MSECVPAASEARSCRPQQQCSAHNKNAPAHWLSCFQRARLKTARIHNHSHRRLPPGAMQSTRAQSKLCNAIMAHANPHVHMNISACCSHVRPSYSCPQLRARLVLVFDGFRASKLACRQASSACQSRQRRPQRPPKVRARPSPDHSPGGHAAGGLQLRQLRIVGGRRCSGTGLIAAKSLAMSGMDAVPSSHKLSRAVMRCLLAQPD